MRSKQVLQLLHSSGHLAATIGPRAGTASCVSGLLRRIVPSDVPSSVSAVQLRGLSAEALPTANDPANTSLADVNSIEQNSPTSVAAAPEAADSLQPAAAAEKAADKAAAAVEEKPSKQRINHHTLTRGKEQLLKDAGLWIPKEIYPTLSAEQQSQCLQQQQQYLWKVKQQHLLQNVTSCNMLVQLSPDLQQLEVVVAATAAADPVGKKSAAAIAARAAEESSSSRSSTPEGISTHQQQQQRRPKSNGSDRQHLRQQQQQQQQNTLDRLTRILQLQQDEWRPASTLDAQGAAAAAAASTADRGKFPPRYLTSPRLDHRSLVKLSGEARIVNLNTQLTQLASQVAGHEKIVDLFDELIERGMQEAQQQQQQQEDDGILVLPQQYRPDYPALAAYCRSLVWLAENRERRGKTSGLRGAMDIYTVNGCGLLRCTMDRAERAAALWGSYKLVPHAGLQVYLALLAAYRADGQPQQAVQLYYDIRAANHPTSFNSYKLHLSALQAAITAKNFLAADEIARVFSSNVVMYSEQDYRIRLVHMYRILATAAAACGLWEKAAYWLQELINNYTLEKVQPNDFFSVMIHTASAGRMDYLRMLIHAADEHMKDQDGKPVVYTEEQLRFLIEAAGRARDVDVIELLWQRLLHDIAPSSSGSSSSRASNSSNDSSADSSNGSSDGSGSSKGSSNSKRADARPSAHAYKTVIRALVDSKQWSKALNRVVEFEHAYGEGHSGSGKDFAAVSVYDGLSFFPLALEEESQVAAVFEAVKARKDSGQPVTTTLMNIVCRSIARLGNTEAAGLVFQSYGVWSTPHDADSYNAIVECCEINGKVVGAESLISYMTSKGIKPNASTWNLLFSTAIRAGDRPAMASALERTMAAGCKVREYLVKRAKPFAQENPYDAQLAAALNKAIRLHGMQIPSVPFIERWRQYQRQHQQQRNGLANAEVWTPSRGSHQRIPMRQHQQQQHQQGDDEEQRQWLRSIAGGEEEQQQQQQPKQQQDDDGSSDEKPEASTGIRSQLRDAFGK